MAEGAPLDLFKWVVGGLLGVLYAICGTLGGWLFGKVLKNSDTNIKQTARIAALEAEVKQLRSGAVTVECVREVVSGELDKREKQAAELRAAEARTTRLELRAEVVASVDAAIPKLVREVRLSLGPYLAGTDRASPKGHEVDGG